MFVAISSSSSSRSRPLHRNCTTVAYPENNATDVVGNTHAFLWRIDIQKQLIVKLLQTSKAVQLNFPEEGVKGNTMGSFPLISDPTYISH